MRVNWSFDKRFDLVINQTAPPTRSWREEGSLGILRCSCLFLFYLWTQVIFSLGTLCVPESNPTCNVSRLTPEPINYKEMPTCQAASIHRNEYWHSWSLGSRRRKLRHEKLAPNYFQHSKSSGPTAKNLQSDFRNVVCTKDCWQILIAKDSWKINRTSVGHMRQVDEMPNWTDERYVCECICYICLQQKGSWLCQQLVCLRKYYTVAQSVLEIYRLLSLTIIAIANYLYKLKCAQVCQF